MSGEKREGGGKTKMEAVKVLTSDVTYNHFYSFTSLTGENIKRIPG